MKSNIKTITSHNFQQIKERKKKERGKEERGGTDNNIKSTHDSPIGLVTFKS